MSVQPALKKFVIVQETHRGLWYEDGVMKRLLEPGRYDLPQKKPRGLFDFGPPEDQPEIRVIQVDMRERELTIKGQEILTADKVSLRVSIIVQFRVTDPAAATHEVSSFEERLYSDVQLAARRSLASMVLEEILTNRNRLSSEILDDVKEIAARYGVAILRADVKDLIFPGNLQEIMNKVLAAERTSQAKLIEARTQAEMRRIEAETAAAIRRTDAEAEAAADRMQAEVEAEAHQLRVSAEVAALKEMEAAADAYESHPALMRLRELDAMKELATLANARLYIGFKKHGDEEG